MIKERPFSLKILYSCHKMIAQSLFLCLNFFIGDALWAQSPQAVESQEKSVFKTGPVSDYFKAESSYNPATGQFLSNLIGFGQDLEGSIQKKKREFPWKFRYRLWLDREKLKPPYTPSYRLIERVIAHIAASLDTTRVSLGLQEVTWGENLIMPVLDVVNPRDLTHPYGYYDSESKIPQPLLLIEQPISNHRIEFIFNPYPFPMKYPEEAVGFRVKTKPRPPPSPDSWEYGSRLLLVHDALETKFYYYHHGTRIPTFIFLPYSGEDTDRPDIEAISLKSDTFGTSVSLASYQWLFRGDLAIHNGYPATNISTKIEKTTTTQAILGLSTITLSQQTIGAELHYERWQKAPLAYEKKALVTDNPGPAQFYWLGLLANLNFFNSRLNPSFVYFHGLDSEDSLLKAVFKYNLDSQSTLSLDWTSTAVKTKSPKLLLGERDSLSSKFSYIF